MCVLIFTVHIQTKKEVCNTPLKVKGLSVGRKDVGIFLCVCNTCPHKAGNGKYSPTSTGNISKTVCANG